MVTHQVSHCSQHDLSELDYLLYSPEDRIGALGFGLNVVPPAPTKRFNKTVYLEKLQWVAEAMVKDEDYPDGSINIQAEYIMLIGTSMGGARPKAVIEDKEGLWIAKFNRFDDRWNQARVEHAMLILARECGLTVANSKLTQVGGKDDHQCHWYGVARKAGVSEKDCEKIASAFAYEGFSH